LREKSAETSRLGQRGRLFDQRAASQAARVDHRAGMERIAELHERFREQTRNESGREFNELHEEQGEAKEPREVWERQRQQEAAARPDRGADGPDSTPPAGGQQQPRERRGTEKGRAQENPY
jgi:crotonobetainyl-CoA:carnitine CoA-transferase CaiB-like acyl-CoA transferase